MKNPTAFGARQGLNWKCFPATSNTDNATIPYTVSTDIHVDPVAWLAARANVATATARVHVELFRIGGRQ